MIAEVDGDNSGEIEFNEFIDLIVLQQSRQKDF